MNDENTIEEGSICMSPDHMVLTKGGKFIPIKDASNDPNNDDYPKGINPFPTIIS